MGMGVGWPGAESNHRYADFQYSVVYVYRVLDSSICVDINQVLVHAAYGNVLNLSFCMYVFLGLFTRKLHARILDSSLYFRAKRRFWQTEANYHHTKNERLGVCIGRLKSQPKAEVRVSNSLDFCSSVSY